MTRILLVEDDYHMAERIKKEFDRKGWEYDRANKVVTAQEFFKKNSYDCIIIDLMIDPLGLTLDEVDEYHPFFGWAWLRNYLLPQKEQTLIDKKTIIFSQFATGLRKSKWKKELKDLIILSKADDVYLKKLIEKIEEVINSNKTLNI